MKKQILKLGLAIIIWITLIALIVANRIYAENDRLSLTITTDKTSYSSGEDIQLKINLNKNIVTASFYINYDSNTVTCDIDKQDSNIAIREHPEDNQIRVVYFDSRGIGTNEITVICTAKANSTNQSTFSLSNTKMTVAGETGAYSQDSIGGINEVAQVSVGEVVPTPTQVPTPIPTQAPRVTPTPTPTPVPTQAPRVTPTTAPTPTSAPTGEANVTPTPTPKASVTPTQVPTSSSDATKTPIPTLEDTTVNKSELPATGENDTLIILMTALILVTIYMGYNAIKIGKEFKF